MFALPPMLRRWVMTERFGCCAAVAARSSLVPSVEQLSSTMMSHAAIGESGAKIRPSVRSNVRRRL